MSGGSPSKSTNRRSRRLPGLLQPGRGRRGGGVRTLTGPVAKACGYRRRGRGTMGARPEDVLAVRTGRTAATGLREARWLPEVALALQHDPGPPGSALLAPLLPKPLGQFPSFGFTDLN